MNVVKTTITKFVRLLYSSQICIVFCENAIFVIEQKGL